LRTVRSYAFILVPALLGLAGLGIYAVYRTPSDTVPMSGSGEQIAWIGLASAVIGLITSLIGLVKLLLERK